MSEYERKRGKCKHCGGESNSVVYGEESDNGPCVYVECDDCEARGSVFYYATDEEYDAARKAALKSWGFTCFQKKKTTKSTTR